MDEVQESSDSECCTPLSEPFRFYFEKLFSKTKHGTSETNNFGKKRYKNEMDVFDRKVALPRVLGKNTARRILCLRA
jgi:hypothetical protein